MFVRSAKNPAEVSSARVLEVMLGAPTSRMVIFTGLVGIRWIVDEDGICWETLTVRLGYRVKTLNPQYTAFVGLASFGNEETDFDVGAEHCYLQVNSENELELLVTMMAKGEKTYLHKLSYQVTAIVETFNTEISGTIRWKTSVASFTRSEGLFEVSSHAGDKTDSPLLATATLGALSLAGDLYSIPYFIGDVPAASQFVLAAAVMFAKATGIGFTMPAGSGKLAVSQVAGDRPVVVDATNRVHTGIDFEMTFLAIK